MLEEIDLSQILPREFYSRHTLDVAKSLLGKILVRRLPEKLLTGRIVEVEAYRGDTDAASHAAKSKTHRNAVMFGPPGFAYVYFIYGMYNCLNFVTEPLGQPAAILVRALEPLTGIETMQKFRKNRNLSALTSGPGKLCQAMSINRNQNGADLTGPEIFLIQAPDVDDQDIAMGPRVGINSARELPWRFCIRGNSFLSARI